VTNWKMLGHLGRAAQGAGRRMASSGRWQEAGAGPAWRARSGRALLFSGAAIVGSGALLASRSPVRAESSDMSEEEPSAFERAADMVGLGSSYSYWVREPAERTGCPPGKLLPDPMDLPPGVVQRTLVLSLEDTLIHTEWDRKFGHRTRKRPGLDAFLAHLSQFYEIVIFTSAMSSYAAPITEKMQENGGYFQHALFNEHTKGNRIKDLSYLNRDLRHVILVDTNPNAYSQQKYNGIAIKPWDGDLNDTELLNLVPFLEAVFKEDIQDVREVIRGMEGHNIPARMRALKQQAPKRSVRGRGGANAGLLASVAVKAPATFSTRVPAPTPVLAAIDEAGPPAPAAEVKPISKLFKHKI